MKFLFKTLFYTILLLALILAFVLTKDYLFSIISKQNLEQIIFGDKTKVEIELKGGEIDRVKIYEERLTKEVKLILNKIDSFKIEQKKSFEQEITLLLKDEFRDAYRDTGKFADWFFGYSTQYKILYQGAVGIVDKYRAGFGTLSLTESATLKITNYISKHYKDRVLKPHLLEPSLKLKLDKLLLKQNRKKISFMQKIDSDFKNFLDKTKADLSNMRAKNPNIDWQSNIANTKGLLSLKSKDGESGLFTIGTTTAITSKIASKVATTSSSKAIAGKIVATTGLKKMIGSLVAKLAGGVSTLGVGLVVGGVVDYSLNEADELANRADFIKDVKKSLDNIRESIEFEIIKQDLIEKLYERDLNLYKKFVNMGRE